MMDAVQQARCVSETEAADIREKLLKLTSNRGRSRFSHMMLRVQFLMRELKGLEIIVKKKEIWL